MLEEDRGNIEQCKLFKSTYIAFKKCNQCGEIYELFSNFKSLDYDMCPICNGEDQAHSGDSGR